MARISDTTCGHDMFWLVSATKQEGGLRSTLAPL